MTREQFLNFVRQPDLVASYSADELQKLVDQFPYCQPLRILQLRHLKDNDSIQYSQKLKVTAAFAPDRVRLYQLMHNVAGETVSANGYESSSVSTPIFESVPIESTYSNITSEEEELTPSEPELTPQEIVENRLKELNLWKENKSEVLNSEGLNPVGLNSEQLNSVGLNSEGLNPEGLNSEGLNSEGLNPEGLNSVGLNSEGLNSVGLNSEQLNSAGLNSERLNPEGLNSEQLNSVGLNSEGLNSEQLNSVGLNSEGLNSEGLNSEGETDPLEELMKEAIVETKIKESDYFSEIGLSEDEEETAEVELEIQKQDLVLLQQEEEVIAEEKVVEDILATTPKVEVQAPTEIVHFTEEKSTPLEKPHHEDHSHEAHSFAEWLRINHPPSEESETPAVSAPKEEAPAPIAETITAEIKEIPKPSEPVSDIRAFEPMVYNIEREVPKAPSVVEEKSTVEQKSTTVDKPATVGKPATADKPAAKVLYIKGGNIEPNPAPRSAPAEAPQPREVYRSSPTPQPIYSARERPIEPVPPSVDAPITPAATGENNGPTLRTNRELGLKEVIKPSKKGKKARQGTDNTQNQAEKKLPGKNEQIKIIEQFIQQEPRITPMKAYNNPVNMARKSVQESDELITETLAAIYAQQGNFEKAISFYEKLSLKIPEKSAYFAALIKDLKNKLNS